MSDIIEAPPSARIGQVYPVTVVKAASDWTRCLPDGCLVPIYGHLHEDKQIIKFPEDHYHIDWRFMAKGPFERLLNERVRFMEPDVPESYLHGIPISKKHIIGIPKVRRMTMLRRMPHHPSEGGKHIHQRRGHPSWLIELENVFEDTTAKRCGRCRVCPHRGVKLGSIRDAKGNLVCPSHGLTWSPQTGKLIRRTQP